jgi:hypothetical protein
LPWCKGDEIVHRETPGDILDMRIEAAILVDHQHHRQLAFGPGRARQQAAHLAMALWRVDLDKFRDDAGIGRRDLLSAREFRIERVEQFERGGAGQRGKTPGALEKVASGQQPVNIAIEQFQHFRMEVAGLGQRFLIGHGLAPTSKNQFLAGAGAAASRGAGMAIFTILPPSSS